VPVATPNCAAILWRPGRRDRQGLTDSLFRVGGPTRGRPKAFPLLVPLALALDSRPHRSTIIERSGPPTRLLSRGAEKAAHHCRHRLSIIPGIHGHSARHLEFPYRSGSGRSRRDLSENENPPGENPKTDKALLIGNQAKIVQPGSMALGAPSISDAA
jgi:hypothetical protein